MDSSAPTLFLNPSLKFNKANDQREDRVLVFDSQLLQKQPNLPTAFVWPNGDLVSNQNELNEPLIDLEGFFRCDEVATERAAELIRKASLNHGFFQVYNHGIDPSLIHAAYDEMDAIFKLPTTKKLSARRKPGGVYGYSGAHADRYSSKLPWKETFSFGYHENDSDSVVVDYFESTFGNDLQHTG